MSYFLNTEDIKKICYEYAQEHLSYDEPIPLFEKRYTNVLEAALDAPQRQLNNQFTYKTLPEQAAVFFYEMIKQHPFLNGNKRIACVSLFVFLSINGHWLEMNWKELYDVAIVVATSPTTNREGTLKLLKDFLKNSIKVLK